MNLITIIDQILTSQANKEAKVNALFDAGSSGLIWGRHDSATAGLTWGVYGGNFTVAGVITQIANQTITLTDNATNYLYATAAGVLTKATSAPSGWPSILLSGAVALYEVTVASGVVTNYLDWRLGIGRPGPAGPADEAFITLTDAATVTIDATTGHNFYWVIGGNRTFANPTGLVNGQCLNIIVKQDGTGSRVWTPGSKWKFANGVSTLSTPANTVDLYGGIYHSGLDLIIGTLAKAIG